MTTVANRVISLYNKKTSMRLTKAEWTILDTICLKEKIKRKALLEMIDQHRDPKLGLTPSVRLFSLLYLYSLTQNNHLGSLTGNNENIQNTLNEMML